MKDQPILEALKQQIEMEKHLSYGDSFNFIAGLVDIHKNILVKDTKELTEIKL